MSRQGFQKLLVSFETRGEKDRLIVWVVLEYLQQEPMLFIGQARRLPIVEALPPNRPNA